MQDTEKGNRRVYLNWPKFNLEIRIYPEWTGQNLVADDLISACEIVAHTNVLSLVIDEHIRNTIVGRILSAVTSLLLLLAASICCSACVNALARSAAISLST